MIKVNERSATIEKCLNRLRYFEDRLEVLYKTGRLYSWIKRAGAVAKRCLDESVLGSIASENKEGAAIVRGSTAIGRIAACIDAAKKRLAGHSKYSEIGAFTHHMKESLRPGLLKTISAIWIIAVAANMLISLVAGSDIGLFGWIIRAAILLSGVTIFFGNIRWEDIKNKSILIGLFTTTGRD